MDIYLIINLTDAIELEKGRGRRRDGRHRIIGEHRRDPLCSEETETAANGAHREQKLITNLVRNQL